MYGAFRGAGNGERPDRRRLLASLLRLASGALGFVGACAVRAQSAVEARLRSQGTPLKTEVWQGEPPVEPLDTMVHFRRSDTNNGRAMTHEILSLTHEEKGKNSFPWTVYAHLDTRHEVGDACVVCSRLHKRGPGWSSGLHSEVFSHHRGVALGVNVEMGNDYQGREETKVIGVNVLAKGPRPAQYGIHVHEDEGTFQKAIGLEGRGEVGLDIRGKYDCGIDLHGHSLKTGGGEIALDEAGEVRIRFREGRIEILNGGKRVAYLSLDEEDRRL